MRLLPVATLAAFAACSLADARVTGSGTSRTESRTTGDFTSVEVKGSLAVDVTVGGARSVTVTADDNVVPVIRTRVERGRLIIDSTDSYTTKLGVRVAITAPALDGLAVSGSAAAQVRGLAARSLALAVSGSGTIDAEGTAAALTVAVSGSGRIRARGVASDDATVAVSGSGGAELQVARGLTVQLSGSGVVDYWGDAQVTKAVSGSGKVRKH